MTDKPRVEPSLCPYCQKPMNEYRRHASQAAWDNCPDNRMRVEPSVSEPARQGRDITTLRHGVYRHYKGEYYLVLGLARHSETEEPMVVYVPLGVKRGIRMAVRPLAMFTSDAPDGTDRARFQYVGQEIME